MRGYKHTPVAIGIMMACLSSTAGASGINRFESTSSYLSTAGAGQATDIGASAAFNNPAGLAALQRTEIEGNLLLIDDSLKFTDKGSFGVTPGFDQLRRDVDYSNGFDAGASLFYGRSLNEDWGMGVSLTSPFGGSSDFGENWVGSNFVESLNCKVLALSVATGYKINSQWSVGASLGMGHMTWELNLDVPPGMEETLDLDDSAPIWTLGIMYQPNTQTRMGLRYMAAVDFDLSGDATLDTPMGAMKDRASQSFSLPDVITFSIEHSLTPKLRLLADVEWTNWSVFEESRIIHEQGPTIVVDRNWQNTWSGALGLSYDLSPAWTLNAGIGYDESAVARKDHKLDPPIDRQVSFAAGARWTINSNSEFSLSYQYLDLGKNKVSQNIPNPAMPLQTVIGESDNLVHILSLGYRYRF
jgi:long-chain fatty acid transport protein